MKNVNLKGSRLNKLLLTAIPILLSLGSLTVIKKIRSKKYARMNTLER